MKIAIDLACLTPSSITGIGVYAQNLSRALIPIAKEKNCPIEAWIPWRKRRMLSTVITRSQLSVNLYNEVTRLWNPPAIVHGPDFKIPRTGKFLKVVTIHDLVEFEAEFSDSDFMADAQNKMRKMLYDCRPDHIICISDFTEQRFRHFFPDLQIPISRIYHGVDHRPGPQEHLQRVHPTPYILYVGTLETRKNAIALIRAFETLKSMSFTPLDLILAGGLGSGHEMILQAIENSPVKGSIRVMNSVKSEALISLYQFAEAFILPSLYEGFGFPVLEAMKMGVPVITSEIGALREVAGDAAIFVNPRNPGEIAMAFENLRSNLTLKNDLIQRGFAQAAKFTWQQTAQQTFEVYEQVFNKKNEVSAKIEEAAD